MRVIGDKVLVDPLLEDMKYKGSIVLPEHNTLEKYPQRVRVKAMGSGAVGHFKVGDYVMLRQGIPREKIDDANHIVMASDILECEVD